MPYAIDLFCGAGGCSEGLIQAGFDILFSSDISPMVEETYRNRHDQLGLIQGVNTWFERSDIRELTGADIRTHISNLEIFQNQTMPDIDLLIGGPSCQGFSRAGRRDRTDPRNMLFGEYVRVVSEIRPNYIVLENVEGFMDMEFMGYTGITGITYPDGSVTPDILRSELTEIGYETLDPQILNAADYGVPQRRNRVFFIGYQQGLMPPVYPTPTVTPENYVTLQDAIGDLISNDALRNEINAPLNQYQMDSMMGRTPTRQGNSLATRIQRNTEFPNQTAIVKERFELFQQGESCSNLKKRILADGIDISAKPALLALCSEAFGLIPDDTALLFQGGRVTKDHLDILLTKKNIRQRLSSSEPSATVVTIPDDYINPWEARTFSVRELARCQSFDDSFEFLGKRTTGGLLRRTEVPQYTQVGNAVPPLLARAVALEIRNVL